MKPIYLSNVVFNSHREATSVYVEAIDGGVEDSGVYQYVCFEASSAAGEPIGQVKIRDAGTYADQKDAARTHFESLGHNVLDVK